MAAGAANFMGKDKISPGRTSVASGDHLEKRNFNFMPIRSLTSDPINAAAPPTPPSFPAWLLPGSTTAPNIKLIDYIAFRAPIFRPPSRLSAPPHLPPLRKYLQELREFTAYPPPSRSRRLGYDVPIL